MSIEVNVPCTPCSSLLAHERRRRLQQKRYLLTLLPDQHSSTVRGRDQSGQRVRFRESRLHDNWMLVRLVCTAPSLRSWPSFPVSLNRVSCINSVQAVAGSQLLDGTMPPDMFHAKWLITPTSSPLSMGAITGFMRYLAGRVCFNCGCG
jgi:hypothetical protein